MKKKLESRSFKIQIPKSIKKSLYVIVTVSSSFFIKEYIITLNNSK